jgi:hypothetical protein
MQRKLKMKTSSRLLREKRLVPIQIKIAPKVMGCYKMFLSHLPYGGSTSVPETKDLYLIK